MVFDGYDFMGSMTDSFCRYYMINIKFILLLKCCLNICNVFLTLTKLIKMLSK